MKKRSVWVYIVTAVVCMALFVLGWALIHMLAGGAFTDTLKEVVHWIVGAVFGAGVAQTMWKMDSKGEK